MDMLDIAKNAFGGGSGSADQTMALVSGLVRMLTSGTPDAPSTAASGLPGLGGLVGALGATNATAGAGGGASGLAGLIQMFASSGLGDLVNSWVSTGQNLPISADQLHHALGSERVAQLASSAGLTPEAALGQLTQLLPSVVDKLTPNGAIPQQGLLEQGLSLLSSFKA